MAIRDAALVEALLILRGEPCAKLLGYLLRVIVENFLSGFLVAIDRDAVFVFLHLLGNFLHNFVALSVADVGRVAALVMADMVGNSHENRIIIQSICGFLYGYELLGFSF